MFIDDIAVTNFFSSRGAQYARIAQTFRSSGAFKVGVVPQFYKHFVPLGLKTTTENQDFLYCDDFRNAALDCLLIWSS